MQKNEMLASVVIPTFNRKEKIAQLLHSLNNQTISSRKYEVIVIDDGSTDGTKKIIKKIKPKLIYLKQKNRGPAAARNEGIKKAKGKVIVFLDSDMIAGRNLLEEHLKMHEKNEKIITRGNIKWLPKYKKNPFSEFAEKTTIMLGAMPIEEGELHWRLFLTCNASIKRNVLLKNPFDESFKKPAGEDLELSYRLHKKGYKIVFAKNAIAWHDREFDLKEFKKDVDLFINEALLPICKKHPDCKEYEKIVEEAKSMDLHKIKNKIWLTEKAIEILEKKYRKNKIKEELFALYDGLESWHMFYALNNALKKPNIKRNNRY